MSRVRKRPQRDETKTRLFEAAARVFVRDGIGGASVEDICVEAGLTRGALYSNFANKDALVLAMLDEHVEHNLVEMERLMAVAATPAEFLELLESPDRRRDGPFAGNFLLHTEFLLYALRNPENRPQIARQQQKWREVITLIVKTDFDLVGIDPPIDLDNAVNLIQALDDGYLLNELIEPGRYTPGTFSRNLLALRALWLKNSPN